MADDDSKCASAAAACLCQTVQNRICIACTLYKSSRILLVLTSHRSTPSPQRDEAVEDSTDYPRPQAPGEAQQEHEHGGYEEPEKHERRRAPDMRESLSHKADVNAPQLAYSASGKPQGRISQPQGKVLG